MKLNSSSTTTPLTDPLGLSSINSADLAIQSRYIQYFDHTHGKENILNERLYLAAAYQALKLLKAEHSSSLVYRDEFKDIKDLLSANAIRYRVVQPESDFDTFDFGVLIAIKKSESESIDLFSRFSNSIYNFNLTAIDSDSTKIVCTKDHSATSTDYDYFLEVYPPLPYAVNSIGSFLNFTFSEFRNDFSLVILFSLISSFLQLMFPSLTVYVTSNVITLGSKSFAYQIGALAILIALVSTASLFVQSLFVTKLETESDKRAQTAVWDRLLKLELSELNKYSNSDLMLRASAISQVRTLLSSSNITSIISFITSFIYLFIMYSYVPYATFYVLPLVVVYLIVLFNKASSGGSLLARSLDQSAQLSSFTLQMLSMLPEVRARGILSSWESRFVSFLKKSQLTNLSFRQRDNSIDLLSKSFLSISFCISFAAIYPKITSHSDSLQTYIYSVLGYTSALTLFASNISSGTTTIALSLVNVLAYWKRAKPLVFAPIEPGYNPSNIDASLTGEVKVDNLFFSYDNDSPTILSNISFTIKPGTINHLRIAPGKGSTTLFKLCLGLYSPTAGSIYYNDHHIDKLNITSLRSQISLSPQQPFIPMGPMGEIFDGPLTSSDLDLTDFLKALDLDQLVSKLRMGLDTPIPPGAQSFSVAQKQRLSIANSLARYPKLIFMDNCMSSLSLETKSSILSYLSNKQITTVVVDNSHEEYFTFDALIDI